MMPRPKNLGTAALALTVLLSAPPAMADAELEALKREARELVEQLKDELEATRRERARLEAERASVRGEREGEPEPEPELAADAPEAPDATERKVDILAQELQTLKENFVLPKDREYKSLYGLGPAASKVYQVERGLSLGGYGEGNWSNKVTDTDSSIDSADALRFVLYTGYKFSDRILLNTEVEFEHGTTSSTVSASDGSVSLEFGYLDFLLHEYANLRAGLVLTPIGFLNEIHEPVFYFGNNRPEVERDIIPSTWRELGAGIFGGWRDELQWRAYLTSSLNAAGFESSGIRDGRQNGNRVFAEDLAGSVRLDYTPGQVPGALLGASAFFGNTGQDQRFPTADDPIGRKPNAFLSLWDVHAQYKYRGVELRALAAFGQLDDSRILSESLGQPIAKSFGGWYAEAGYDIMPLVGPYIYEPMAHHYFAPFFRYEYLDPQGSVASGVQADRSQRRDVYTLGFSYKPHPQVVLKLDYRHFAQRAIQRPDEINLGLGFIF